MAIELFSYILLVTMSIVPIVNPFSTAPVFISMTAHLSSRERHEIATMACVYMGILLLAFLFLGALILQFFGISLPSLRLAGGLVISFMGFRMLFPSADAENAESQSERQDARQLTFTPLAIPMLCGPGSISVVLAMATEVSQTEDLAIKALGYLVVSIGVVGSVVICWLVLWSSGKVVRFLGENGINAITKLMGFFLICVGVEFITSGIQMVIAAG